MVAAQVASLQVVDPLATMQTLYDDWINEVNNNNRPIVTQTDLCPNLPTFIPDACEPGVNFETETLRFDAENAQNFQTYLGELIGAANQAATNSYDTLLSTYQGG